MKQLRFVEIETIKNTPITREVFEMDKFEDIRPEICIANSGEKFDQYLTYLEELRLAYVRTNDRKYLDTLVTMLPNTYLPVNLRSVPSYVKKSVKKWNEKHPDNWKKYQDKEYKREYARKYYQMNKKVLNERKKEYKKKYYYEHREEILAKMKMKRNKE